MSGGRGSILDLPGEEWRSLPQFPGYEISSFGRIASHKMGQPRLLRSTIQSRNGYRRTHLMGQDGHKTPKQYVHRLVTEAFYGPAPAGCTQVRHLNGDKLDNRAANLRWGTVSENVLDNVRHGVHNMVKRTTCPSGHPYTPENVRLYRGRRYCRTCQATRSRQNTERRHLAVAS